MIGFRVFAVIVLTGFALVLPSFAQNAPPSERPYSAAEVWDFDSLNPAHAAQTDRQLAAQEVHAAMVRMAECWNAHDLEGYLATFWHSPALLWVEDGAVLNGWQSLHDRFVRGYNNPDAMGHATLDRVQVRMVNTDRATILERWTVAFPHSRRTVSGIDTCDLQRVDGIWQVTVSHSSSLDL